MIFQVSIKEEINIKEPIELEKEKVELEPVMPEDLPVRRKRTAEMAGSYDWTQQLVEPGFCAAPVSCFKHVSFSEELYITLYIYATFKCMKNIVFRIFVIYNPSIQSYCYIINIYF